VDWRADLATVRNLIGNRIAVQGNVNPDVLLGPEEGVRGRPAKPSRKRAASATS